jgi:hypothetical protein
LDARSIQTGTPPAWSCTHVHGRDADHSGDRSGSQHGYFSVLQGVLLKPLPYPHPDQLIGVWHTAPGLNIKELNASPSNYFIYREQNRTFQDVGLYTGDLVNVTGLAAPEQVRALDVTDGVLPILGIPPTLGRWFT